MRLPLRRHPTTGGAAFPPLSPLAVDTQAIQEWAGILQTLATVPKVGLVQVIKLELLMKAVVGRTSSETFQSTHDGQQAPGFQFHLVSIYNIEARSTEPVEWPVWQRSTQDCLTAWSTHMTKIRGHKSMYWSSQACSSASSLWQQPAGGHSRC